MYDGICMGEKERYLSEEIMGKGLGNIKKFREKWGYSLRENKDREIRERRERERGDGAKL